MKKVCHKCHHIKKEFLMDLCFDCFCDTEEGQTLITRISDRMLKLKEAKNET